MSPVKTDQLKKTVLAFRGYNVTNQGRTAELFETAEFVPVLEHHLGIASEVSTRILGRPVDLIRDAKEARPSNLETYPEDLALIVSVELAQLELLKQRLDVDVSQFGMLMGYSLGEITAVIAAGLFSFEAALGPLLCLAEDSAKLASDITMGILFSRGPAINTKEVEKLCLKVTNEGKGTISISTYLSPNTVLLLGQKETMDRFKALVKTELPAGIKLKKNPDQWPPLHTPIMRQANIPNRASVMMETVPGGFFEPEIPILSCVTGELSYNEFNARELLYQWIDHPLQLWEAVHTMLDEGMETIIHVGPQPNIIPATLTRLSNNVSTQLNQPSLSGFGLRTFSQLAHSRRWLRNLISKDAPLLRAPFVKQIVLEDFLLDNEVSQEAKKVK